jgi:diadenylate cyclase
MITALFVDPDSPIEERIIRRVEDQGDIGVVPVNAITDAWERLRREEYSVLVWVGRAGDTRGIEFIKEMQSIPIRIPSVLITDQMDHTIASIALNAGLSCYLWESSAEHFPDLLASVIRNQVFRWQITERLRKDNTLMRVLHDASPLATCVVKDHRIIWMNELMPRILGYRECDLIGIDPLRLIPDEAEHRRIDEALYEGPKEGEWRSVECHLKRQDNSTMHVHILAKLLDPDDPSGGFMIIGQDITAFTRMKDLLRQSEVRYQHLMDSANSIVLRIDTGGIIRFVNRFGEEFFGFPAGELIGRHVVGTIIPRKSRSGRDLSAMIRDVMNNPAEYEVNVNENMKRDGERVWIAWTNKAIRDEHGKILEMLSIGTDITDRQLDVADIQISTAPWTKKVIADTDIGEPVFSAVYSLSVEISKEGREGKPIGTTFLLGDAKNVLAKSTQLILNPFEGHPAASKMITNPEIRETVKELSPIDGAFVICGDGVVEAAGRYITIDASRATIPRGLGTRHASVAGITQETKAIGIVVSQSGGRISIFKDGRIFRVIRVNE